MDTLPLVTETPDYPPAKFTCRDQETDSRARREDVLSHIGRLRAGVSGVRTPARRALVDDRSPEEYSGDLKEHGNYPQRYLRRGHIPGAVSLPWAELLDTDCTFKSTAELDRILRSRKLTPDLDVIENTRIGERADVTWFVLHELMGFGKVHTYDGSWTERGNLIGMPIDNTTRPERRAREQRAFA